MGQAHEPVQLNFSAATYHCNFFSAVFKPVNLLTLAVLPSLFDNHSRATRRQDLKFTKKITIVIHVWATIFFNNNIISNTKRVVHL